MDYVYNYNDMQFFAETKNDIEERMQRRLTYYRMYLYAYMVGKISKEKQDVFVLGQRKLFRAENIWDDDKMEGKTSYNGDCSLHDIRKCAS